MSLASEFKEFIQQGNAMDMAVGVIIGGAFTAIVTSLTTDIIVGFPGETEEDFAQVLSLMQEVRFESAFMYYFNPREGTPAATMEGQVDLETRKKRLGEVIDLQLAITRSVMADRVGRIVKVLADTVSRNDRGELLGKTGQNERVAFAAPPSRIGQFVNVSLDSVNGNTFRGRMA